MPVAGAGRSRRLRSAPRRLLRRDRRQRLRARPAGAGAEPPPASRSTSRSRASAPRSSQRIMAAEPGEAGAVAAALLVGERSALSDGNQREPAHLRPLPHPLHLRPAHDADRRHGVLRRSRACSPSRRGWRSRGRSANGRRSRRSLVLTVYFALSGGGAATVRSYVMARDHLRRDPASTGRRSRCATSPSPPSSCSRSSRRASSSRASRCPSRRSPR